ncbi:MAG: hypothetical protein HQK79_11580 [Desulfobacterales bacterium]|nr:hypothetical protein [Desulfobacterales bacterium]MBF0396976.1 hypothetical protein [Desulfobacterales bacterium]
MEEMQALIGKIKLFTHDGLVYGHKFTNIVVQALLLFIFVFVINTGFLYFCNMLWSNYSATTVGQYFFKYYSEYAEIICNILNNNLIYFSAKITLISFIVCLIIGSVLRFLHILSYFYQHMGFLTRLFLWGLPLTAGVAWVVQSEYKFDHLASAYAVSLIPTEFLFSGCFLFVCELLPELGEVFSFILGKDKR